MAAAPAALPGAVAGSGPESAERSSANSNGPAPDAPEPAVGQAVSKGRAALGAASWPGPDGRASPEGRQLRRFKAAGSFVRYAVRAESEAAKRRRKESVCINPDGRLRNTWDAMMSFVLIVIGTVLPFRIGFQVEIEVTSVIGVASVLTDVLFIVDIVLNFNTGYTRPDGQFEMNRKKARLYYLKHWFFIDLLASLPIRYIGWLMKAQADSDESFTKVVKVLRLLRLTHLLRLAKFRKQWEQHKEEFAGLQTAGKLLACIFAMLYACHCIACAWFYFGTMGADGAVAAPGGWIEAEWPDHTHGPNGTFNGVDNVERYVTSLYWAITVVSTVGFGEIHPETTVEKAFSTFAELVGCFIFMVLVGNLSSIMLSESPIDKKVKQALGEAREFLLDKQVDGKLRARTLGALEHTFRARVHDEKHKIIGELPKAMQEVLQENLYAAFNDLALFRPFRECTIRGALCVVCIRDGSRAVSVRDVRAPTLGGQSERISTSVCMHALALAVTRSLTPRGGVDRRLADVTRLARSGGRALRADAPTCRHAGGRRRGGGSLPGGRQRRGDLLRGSRGRAHHSRLWAERRRFAPRAVAEGPDERG